MTGKTTAYDLYLQLLKVSINPRPLGVRELSALIREHCLMQTSWLKKNFLVT